MVKDEEENAGNEAAEVGGAARLLKIAHKEGSGGINSSRSSCPSGDRRGIEDLGAGCIDR